MTRLLRYLVSPPRPLLLLHLRPPLRLLLLQLRVLLRLLKASQSTWELLSPALATRFATSELRRLVLPKLRKLVASLLSAPRTTKSINNAADLPGR